MDNGQLRRRFPKNIARVKMKWKIQLSVQTLAPIEPVSFARHEQRLRRKRETAPEKSYAIFNGTMFASAAAFK
jgi:hypothetical protein